MMRITYRLIGNPYQSWIVGCDICGRRLHVDWAGRFRDHNERPRQGVHCEGSGQRSKEFLEREKRILGG